MPQLITTEIDLIDPDLLAIDVEPGTIQHFAGTTEVNGLYKEAPTYTAEIKGTVATVQTILVDSEHGDAVGGKLTVRIVRLVDGTVVASHNFYAVYKSERLPEKRRWL
jgi:hypothetical protein